MDRPSTLNQRMALYNMYAALRWDLKLIRNMTFRQASEAIDEAKNRIKEDGFPKKEEFSSYNYQNYEY